MARDALYGHVIVCGYGTVGQKVIEIIMGKNLPFVVVENDPKKISHLNELGYRAVEGDATSSNTLKKAGIESAKAIAISMDDDAKNLFAVLAARDLNRGIFIAARANDDFVREKLIEAGADHIVMPNRAASREIVNEILKGNSK